MTCAVFAKMGRGRPNLALACSRCNTANNEHPKLDPAPRAGSKDDPGEVLSIREAANALRVYHTAVFWAAKRAGVKLLNIYRKGHGRQACLPADKLDDVAKALDVISIDDAADKLGVHRMSVFWSAKRVGVRTFNARDSRRKLGIACFIPKSSLPAISSGLLKKD